MSRFSIFNHPIDGGGYNWYATRENSFRLFRFRNYDAIKQFARACQTQSEGEASGSSRLGWHLH